MQSILFNIDHLTFNNDLTCNIEHLDLSAKCKMLLAKWSGATHA